MVQSRIDHPATRTPTWGFARGANNSCFKTSSVLLIRYVNVLSVIEKEKDKRFNAI
jgi:hypothetical protein